MALLEGQNRAGQLSRSAAWKLPQGLKDEIRRYTKTSLPLSLLAAGTDWLLLLTVLWLGALLLAKGSGFITTAATPLLWLLTGRAVRGLEEMLHEFSHVNVVRANRRLNDLLGDIIAGRPLLRSVAMFREPHARHHAYYGTTNDPGLARFEQSRVAEWRRPPAPALLARAANRLPAYVMDYWTGAKASGRIVKFLAFHAALLAVGYAKLGSTFAASWFVYFVLPFTLLTPYLRSLAESEEHSYDGDVLASTFSNLGFWQRLILHPHGAAYHQLHHLIPSVPHHRLRAAHRLLMNADPAYRRLCARRSIFADLSYGVSSVEPPSSLQTGYDYAAYWREIHRRFKGKLTAVGFDRLPEWYNRGVYRRRFAALHALLRRHVPLVYGQRVLEGAAGVGAYLPTWRRRRARVVGFDLSPEAVTVLRAKCPEASFFEADLTTDDLAAAGVGAEEFDLATLIDVLYHLVDDASFRRALAHVAIRVKPGGHLVVSDVFTVEPLQVAPHVKRRPLDMYEDVLRPLGYRVVGRQCVYAILGDPAPPVRDSRRQRALAWSWRTVRGVVARTPQRFQGIVGGICVTLLAPLDRLAVRMIWPGDSLEMVLFCRDLPASSHITTAAAPLNPVDTAA